MDMKYVVIAKNHRIYCEDMETSWNTVMMFQEEGVDSEFIPNYSLMDDEELVELYTSLGAMGFERDCSDFEWSELVAELGYRGYFN